MIIYAGKDYQDVSRKAANIMSAQIIMKPDAVLGLATGSTPVGMYAQLVEWYKKGDLDFSRVTSVNLDEYKGLSGDNDQSYRYFMDHNLFDHVNIDKARTFVPDGLEEDSDKACAQYNEIIRQPGGVDMQLLGIGGNGHIGFNEPGDAFEKETKGENEHAPGPGGIAGTGRAGGGRGIPDGRGHGQRQSVYPFLRQCLSGHQPAVGQFL